MEKGEPSYTPVGMLSGKATLANGTEFAQEVISKTALCPSNCTTGYLPQRDRGSEKRGHTHPSVHSNHIHNRQSVETVQMTGER